jgi:hypothetical protein
MFRTSVFALALILSNVVLAGENSLPYKEFLKRNVAGVNQISTGMSKDQVVAIMKDYTTTVHDAVLTNPYRNEVVQRGSDTYEVLYYITRRHPPFTPIIDAQTVPIILKNGVVVGWGKTALLDLRRS